MTKLKTKSSRSYQREILVCTTATKDEQIQRVLGHIVSIATQNDGIMCSSSLLQQARRVVIKSNREQPVEEIPAYLQRLQLPLTPVGVVLPPSSKKASEDVKY